MAMHLLSKAGRLCELIGNGFGAAFTFVVMCIMSIPIFLEDGANGVIAFWRYMWR